jgi:thioesterase domain-containing protein
VRLFARIERVLGVRLPVVTLFQAPTVEQLAMAVREADGSSGWSTLVPIQAGGSQPPFFCVHGLGGGVLGYAELAHLVGSEQPFYGLQPRGLDGVEPPHNSIEAMATDYIEAMRAVQPDGPYYLGGYSSGGVVAFEMAHQLQSQGNQVGLLALFDTYAPLLSDEPASLWHLRTSIHFLRNLPRWLWDILQRRDGSRRLLARIAIAFRSARLRADPERDALLFQAAALNALGDTRGISEERRRLAVAHLRALESYRPPLYAGRLTLFRVPGMQLFRAYDAELGWGALTTGGVEVHMIGGAHYDILEKPHVQELAVQLKACLARARTAR